MLPLFRAVESSFLVPLFSLHISCHCTIDSLQTSYTSFDGKLVNQTGFLVLDRLHLQTVFKLESSLEISPLVL